LGPYRDLVDICRRNADKRINRRALEALIKAGAFDCFGHTRAVLMAALDQVLQITDQHQKAAVSGQSDFFGLATEAVDEVAPLNVDYATGVREWSAEELLACEKETLGLYLSGHPIDRYRTELSAFASSSLSEIRPGKRRIAGFIMSVRIIKTRRGRMAVISLDDQTARVEVTVYREVYERNLDKLVTDSMVIIEGECSVDEFSGDHAVQASEIMTLDEARNRLARALVLSLSENALTNGFVHELETMIGGHEHGRCPVAIEYTRADSRARLKLSERWRVNLSEGLLDGLKRQFGAQHVHLEY
jgi:DNA polymerase-3 subunit alpha